MDLPAIMQQRLEENPPRGCDIYQEYIVSITIRHKDTESAHRRWQRYIEDCLKAKVKRNSKVKAVQFLKGLKRTHAMAAMEGEWLKM